MSAPPLPEVSQTFKDNSLGNVDLSAKGVFVVMGCSDSGTANVPTKYRGDSKPLVTAFGRGPGPQLAALLLGAGGTVIFVKNASTNAGALGSIDVTGVHGTSVITATGTPSDTFNIIFKVKKAGTIAALGIKFIYSTDGGLTYSAVISLGTANAYLIPNTGVTLHFAAGTLLVDDVALQPTTEPTPAQADITSAFTTLQASTLKWELAVVASKVASADFTIVDTSLTSLFNAIQYRAALTGARVPNVGESDATYQGVVITDFASSASIRILVSGGAAIITSPLDGSQYLRPAVWAVAARAIVASPGEDCAQVDKGPLGQVSLYDTLQNPIARTHDEEKQPGLNDERFATLRTIPNLIGDYVGNPNLMSPAGSDFTLLQHIRCMNLAADVSYQKLVLRLSSGVRVYKSGPRKGFILERDARKVESAVNSALKTALVDTGDVTDAFIQVSRTDALLSNGGKLTSNTFVIPLAYIKGIANVLQFLNPALTATING